MQHTLPTKQELSNMQSTIQGALKDVLNEIAEVKASLAEGEFHQFKSTPIPQQGRLWSDTRVHRWIFDYLGINLNLIVSRVDGQSSQNVILQCPISSNKVLKVRIQSLRPPWPNFLIYPCFKIQNIVPCDSEMVKACRSGNTTKMRELISAGWATPDDTTVDRVTVLHACIFQTLSCMGGNCS
jgi:hypothetical protein